MVIDKLKNKLENLAIRHSYTNSIERYEDRLFWGEVLLELKRNIWNSKDIEFVPTTWDEFGFRVFSQSNEDGIIQYLIRQIDIPNKTFIEFGAADYSECNTRFLLLNNRWSGLIMDGSVENIKSLREKSIYWKYDIDAVAAFITRDNINDLIRARHFEPEVGILSIDIDGVDYWIWEQIDCINPAIVICEINPIFGPKAKVTVPYKEDFYRTTEHYSNLYWGMSLGAATHLAKKKGYKLVCMNQLGQNAFYVREDLLGNLKEVSTFEAYRPLSYRESRNPDGTLSYLRQEDGLNLIGDCMVIDLEDDVKKKVSEIFHNE